MTAAVYMAGGIVIGIVVMCIILRAAVHYVTRRRKMGGNAGTYFG